MEVRNSTILTVLRGPLSNKYKHMCMCIYIYIYTLYIYDGYDIYIYIYIYKQEWRLALLRCCSTIGT